MMKGLPENSIVLIEAAQEAVVFIRQRIADFADTGSLLTNDIRTTYSLLEQSDLNVIYFIPGYFADNAFAIKICSTLFAREVLTYIAGGNSLNGTSYNCSKRTNSTP